MLRIRNVETLGAIKWIFCWGKENPTFILIYSGDEHLYLVQHVKAQNKLYWYR